MAQAQQMIQAEHFTVAFRFVTECMWMATAILQHSIIPGGKKTSSGR